MALRSILLIPSRWMAGGLAPSRLLGGGTGPGKEGVCSRWAGAFAEQADSTCPPGATGKSTPMLWASWPRGQSPDGQALASLSRAVLPEPLARAWGRSAFRSLSFPICPVGRAIPAPLCQPSAH